MKFCKIVSIKAEYEVVRTNDPLKNVVSNINDEKLTLLANFAKRISSK